MGKQDDELLTMARIKRLLLPLSHEKRQRICAWMNSFALDTGEPVLKAPPDPRQMAFPE